MARSWRYPFYARQTATNVSFSHLVLHSAPKLFRAFLTPHTVSRVLRVPPVLAPPCLPLPLPLPLPPPQGLGLEVDPRKPLVAVVSRLVPQKGIHLIKVGARAGGLGREVLQMLVD